MSEELNQEEEIKTEETNQEEVKVDPFEEKALAMGWRPKTDFEGEEVDFIDAKEFVRRKPLFDKIEVTKKELKETQKALKTLQGHYDKVRETEYTNALSTLQSKKKQALTDGDADALIEIDDQILDIKTEERLAKEQAKQVSTQPDPRFVTWVAENKWYTTDGELRSVADEVGLAHSKSNPDKSPEEVLEYVVKRVKKLYPEKFVNPNKSRPSSVEGGSAHTPTRQSNTDDFELTEEEQRVMTKLVRAGALTKEQYITDLKMIKGVR